MIRGDSTCTLQYNVLFVLMTLLSFPYRVSGIPPTSLQLDSFRHHVPTPIASNSTLFHLQNDQPTLQRIMIGACNNQNKPMFMWERIEKHYGIPDLFIWLGDIVYADSKKYPFVPILGKPSSLDHVRAQYLKLKTHPGYQHFINQTSTIGIYDDHDYNCNNGGIDCFSQEFQSEIQDILFEFLDEPQDSERRTRRGVYGSYTFGEAPQQVKILLLDARTFRDAPDFGSPRIDMLGKEQWQWLEEELANSTAQLHLIASGIQILPSDKLLIEKWGNFPSSRKRLFGLIEKYRVEGVILLSGDIHTGQILRDDCATNLYPIFELTSSGLTHSCQSTFGHWIPYFCEFFDRYVITSKTSDQPSFFDYNFGTIEINWDESTLDLQIRDQHGQKVRNRTISFSQIQPHANRIPPEPLTGSCPGRLRMWHFMSVENWMFLIGLFTSIIALSFGPFIVYHLVFFCCSKHSKKNLSKKKKE